MRSTDAIAVTFAQSEPSNKSLGSLLFILIAAGASIVRAEPPALALDADRLAVTNVAIDAPPTITIASEDVASIAWTRGGQRDASLPLLLMPTASDPIAVTALATSRSISTGDASIPRVRIDSSAYQRISAWRPTPSPAARRTTVLLGIAMTATLLLAALVGRRRTAAVIGTCIAWSIALTIASHRRPTLFTRDDADGTRWFMASEARTLRVPIAAGERWVPIVESAGHLRTLSPRIIVNGRAATIELTVPKHAKVGLRPQSP